MKKLWVWSAVCVLGGAMAAPAVYAQATDIIGSGSYRHIDTVVQREQEAREIAEKARIAEEIIAREETAMGRHFDAAFLGRIRADLATRSLEELAEVQKRGSGLLPSPRTAGDTTADFVYNPVTPCRIINTLLAGGPIAAGTTRSFRVTGTNFSAQGGTAGNCNVPVGATGAVINFVAVAPAGAGDLRYTPFGIPVPTASFLNYVNSGIPNDNVANGMTFPICNPATTTCTSDFTIQADVSGTDVVADVQGFFRRVTLTAPVKSVTFNQVALNGFTCVNHSQITIVAPSAGFVTVRGDAEVQLNHTTGTTTEVVPILGATATACSTTVSGNFFVSMSGSAPSGTYFFETSSSGRFAVAAGSNTFFLNALQTSGATGSGVIFSGGLEAVFTPN